MLGNNTREVQDIDVALGRWLAENTPAGSLIAVDDIGAIAFLSGRRIVDMNGLVSPEVWPATRAAEGLPRSQILTRILSQDAAGLYGGFSALALGYRDTIRPWPSLCTMCRQIPIPLFSNRMRTVYEMTWPYLAEADPQNDISGHDLVKESSCWAMISRLATP